MSARISSADRRAVPSVPSPPAFETAAASPTDDQGPSEPWITGTSMPSRSQSGVRIVTQHSLAQPPRNRGPAAAVDEMSQLRFDFAQDTDDARPVRPPGLARSDRPAQRPPS